MRVVARAAVFLTLGLAGCDGNRNTHGDAAWVGPPELAEDGTPS